MNFMNAVENRRTYYGINAQSPVSDDTLFQLLTDAVKFTPSAFDSRSSRALLLLGESHKTFWELTLGALRKVVTQTQFPSTQEKISSFAAGHGTILFYEDQDVVRQLQEKVPLYRENFPIWSQQSSGMLQYVVWTGLEELGLGASLQHYNPLVDEAAAAAFAVPNSWKLIAQMPFGSPTKSPEPRDAEELSHRVRRIG